MTDLFFYRHNKHQQRVQSMQPNKIHFCELTICLDGKLDYFVDNVSVPLRAGDIVFIADGQMRSRMGYDEYADYVSFNFRTDEPICLSAHQKKVVDKEIRLLLMCCDEIFAERGLSDNLTLALLAIINKLRYLATRPSYAPLTQSIMRILQQKVYEKITLDELSKLTYFSAAYCENVFRKDTGVSIIKYFNHLKTEEAKALMIEGGLSLSKIADKLGYDDYNYFSRLFKKECGYSPKEYLSNLSAK